MVLEIPDQILLRSRYSVEELKMDIAVMLYQKQMMSLARAADWLGLSRVDFQKELKFRSIYLHYEVSDLHEELATLEKFAL